MWELQKVQPAMNQTKLLWNKAYLAAYAEHIKHIIDEIPNETESSVFALETATQAAIAKLNEAAASAVLSSVPKKMNRRS